MKNRVIIFVTDRHFILPTIHVMSQIFDDVTIRHNADCILYAVDLSHDELSIIKDAVIRLPVEIYLIESATLNIPDGISFNKTHVPLITIVRLLIAPLIPPQYEHVLYLDGDTRIAGSIAPLVMHDVAPGKIAAACDAMWLYEGDRGPYWAWARRYLKSLGIENPRDYFNAGVMAFRRDTWLEIARLAFEYFITNSSKCYYHDQSALNAVCRGKREALSPRWNFLSNYASVVSINDYKIELIHFSGGDKPWFYDGPPWNGRFIDGYRDTLRDCPRLEAFWSPPDAALIENSRRKNMQQEIKTMLLMPWRRPMRKKRFHKYCATAQFVM
jgi:lipopolysaccharide biosynthesis glycosyltransferase